MEHLHVRGPSDSIPSAFPPLSFPARMAFSWRGWNITFGENPGNFLTGCISSTAISCISLSKWAEGLYDIVAYTLLSTVSARRKEWPRIPTHRLPGGLPLAPSSAKLLIQSILKVLDRKGRLLSA